MAEVDVALLSACLAWWESKRPAEWTEAKHAEVPIVNCSIQQEEELARQIAKLVRHE